MKVYAVVCTDDSSYDYCMHVTPAACYTLSSLLSTSASHLASLYQFYLGMLTFSYWINPDLIASHTNYFQFCFCDVDIDMSVKSVNILPTRASLWTQYTHTAHPLFCYKRISACRSKLTNPKSNRSLVVLWSAAIFLKQN